VLDPTTGIPTGLRSGGAYIDLTTNAPRVVCRLAEACGVRDVEMLDAPVSGRPSRMTIMAGIELRTSAARYYEVGYQTEDPRRG
jgi:3-hydroxyisobutyrate dehydrogenase-like beta-hydroxyacid dehydrogenase